MSHEIPEGWRGVRLGEVAHETRVRNLDQRIPPERLVGVFKGEGMVPTRDRVRGESVERCKIVAPGAFAYNPMRLNIGSIARWHGSEEAIVSPDYVVFEADPTHLDGNFLDHLRGSAPWQKFTAGAGDGGVRVRIYFDHLAEFRFALPPLPEQKRIAEILSSIDETIEVTQAVIEQTRNVTQGLLKRLLTKGIGHTQFRQTEIGEIPAAWATGTVKDFFELQRGFDLTEKQATPGEYPVISSSGVSYFHGTAAIQGPAVITGRKGKLGMVHYHNGPCWPHDTTLWVKDFKGNLPRYVYWYLLNMQLEQFDAATAVPTLNRNNVHVVKAAFPPIAEQIDIAARLDALEEVAAKQMNAAEQLQRNKNALMSDLLTGRKRVSRDLRMAAE